METSETGIRNSAGHCWLRCRGRTVYWHRLRWKSRIVRRVSAFRYRAMRLVSFLKDFEQSHKRASPLRERRLPVRIWDSKISTAEYRNCTRRMTEITFENKDNLPGRLLDRHLSSLWWGLLVWNSTYLVYTRKLKESKEGTKLRLRHEKENLAGKNCQSYKKSLDEAKSSISQPRFCPWFCAVTWQQLAQEWSLETMYFPEAELLRQSIYNTHDRSNTTPFSWLEFRRDNEAIGTPLSAQFSSRRANYLQWISLAFFKLLS